MAEHGDVVAEEGDAGEHADVVAEVAVPVDVVHMEVLVFSAVLRVSSHVSHKLM